MSLLARTRAEASVRVSDAERERAAAQLKEHALAGRLSVDELGERAQEAYTARRRSDLAHALRELPDLEALDYRLLHAPFRTHLALSLAVNAAALVLWAVTRQPGPTSTDLGAGYYWPLWVLVTSGVLLAVDAFRARGTRPRALDPGR